jgi:hypothetical protein
VLQHLIEQVNPRAGGIRSSRRRIHVASDDDRASGGAVAGAWLQGFRRRSAAGSGRRSTARRKESPVGPRVWRDLLVGPRGLPPESTPDGELVRGTDGHVVLAREQLGPSYRAAFGLVAFVHLMSEQEHGQVILEDQGIRTHGTGNLTSLANGVSHGCHRLLGRNVVRLADFVLAYHDHIRNGETPTYYRRVVHYGGSFPIAIDSLGYRIELVPPIPVDVLPGRTRR